MYAARLEMGKVAAVMISPGARAVGPLTKNSAAGGCFVRRVLGGGGRERGAGMVAGRFIRCKSTAQVPPVANRGVTDVTHQGRQHGEVLPQGGRAGDFGVGRPRPNRDPTLMELDVLRHDA